MFDYLRKCWEVGSVSELTPVQAEIILLNALDGYSTDQEVWNVYAFLHALSPKMTIDEYRDSEHYQTYVYNLFQKEKRNAALSGNNR